MFPRTKPESRKKILDPKTSKIELFVTLISHFQTLTNVTKNLILNVMGVLDLPLIFRKNYIIMYCKLFS